MSSGGRNLGGRVGSRTAGVGRLTPHLHDAAPAPASITGGTGSDGRKTFAPSPRDIFPQEAATAAITSGRRVLSYHGAGFAKSRVHGPCCPTAAGSPGQALSHITGAWRARLGCVHPPAPPAVRVAHWAYESLTGFWAAGWIHRACSDIV